jgi:hypothetical protein
MMALMASNTEAELMPPSEVVEAAPALLVAPDRPALGHLGTLVFAARRSGKGGSQKLGGDTDVAEDRHLDRVEPAQRHRVEVDLDDCLVGGDAGVLGEGGPEGDHQVALVHEP